MVETYLKRKQWYFSPVLKESSSMVLINAEQKAAMALHNRENIPVPNRERERERRGVGSHGVLSMALSMGWRQILVRPSASRRSDLSIRMSALRPERQKSIQSETRGPAPCSLQLSSPLEALHSGSLRPYAASWEVRREQRKEKKRLMAMSRWEDPN